MFVSNLYFYHILQSFETQKKIGFLVLPPLISLCVLLFSYDIISQILSSKKEIININTEILYEMKYMNTHGRYILATFSSEYLCYLFKIASFCFMNDC